jgi:four helix bundle protein
VIKLYQALPTHGAAQVIGKQLLRCGTAVGANYRAAGRARSRAEFAAKLGIVVEEADECIYWLELLGESNVVKPELLTALQDEAKELTAIFTAARKSAKK